MPERLGFTIPVLPFSVRESCDFARRAEDAGYTDAWSMEAGGTDAFSVAAAVGAVTERLRVGTAIVPAFTRPPALIAMSTLSAAQACDERFVLGLGASSQTIVEGWMGVPYEQPLGRVRETVGIVKQALAGDKVTHEGRTVRVKGFRMEQSLKRKVPIFLAALGPKMLELAAEVADGVALFLCNEEGVRMTSKGAPGKELMARLMCFVDDDPAEARSFARWLLTPYAVVPGYNRFLSAQGLDAEAEAIVKLWTAGDRRGASEAVSDRMIDELVIIGPPQACKERIESFRGAGLDTPVLMFLSTRGPKAVEESLWSMAPSA